MSEASSQKPAGTSETADVIVYSTELCPYCIRAKILLGRRNIPFQEIDATGDTEMREWLVKETRRRTVPQIRIRGQWIGGFEELHALDRAGKLAEMVKA